VFTVFNNKEENTACFLIAFDKA